MKDLRYTWNRGRDGLALEFHEPGQAPLDELKAISDAWLGGKQVREKGFSLGRFTPAYLNFFRIAIVRHQGKPVAFANLLETDSRELASLDLMRVHPEAPKLTMEFLMLGLILHYKAQGHARFSLGMVPLAGLQPGGAPLTQRLGALVFRRGEQFYNFQGLRRFGQVPARLGTPLPGRASRARPAGGPGRYRRADRRRPDWIGETLICLS